MNGRVGLLGGLLIVQLIIVALVLWNQNRAEGAAGKLLDLDAGSVDRIVIADASTKIELVRRDGSWSVAGAPADAAKVDKLVNDFTGFESAWPVATTAASAGRFEVTEEKFQRRLTFHAGEKVAGDVLLGTSPGFQRVHARKVGSDSIYAVNFSNFQASTKAEDWLDKALLAADGALKSVVGPSGFRLEKGKEGWLLDGTAADQDSATTFAERFENLRIIGPAAAAGTTDKGSFTLVDGKGEYTLRLSQGSEDTEYVVRSSRRDGFYRMAAYIAEQMLEGREELEPKKPDASGAKEEGGALKETPVAEPTPG
jgi:hypothetical protein